MIRDDAPPAPFTVLIDLQVRPDRVEDATRLLPELAGAVLAAADGVERYEVHRDAVDGAAFTLVEGWRDRDAFERWQTRRSQQVERLLARAPELLAAPARTRFLRRLP